MSKGMAFIKSPYGFEVFLNPGEVVNLAGVWLCMISIIIKFFTSSNRFLLLEIGPSGSWCHIDQKWPNGVWLWVWICWWKFPGSHWRFSKPTDTMLPGYGFYQIPVWLSMFFYQKGPFYNFLNIIIFGTGHIYIGVLKYIWISLSKTMFWQATTRVFDMLINPH